MKKLLQKILSFLSVIGVILSVFSAFTLVSVAASIVADVLGLYSDDDYNDLIDQCILSGSGMTAEEFIATYYEDYYDYISSDYWGLASGSGGVYGSDNNFNDEYLEATELQLGMFFAGNGLPFDWDEFVFYAKSRRAAEIESSSFSTSDYVGSNNLKPVSISGDGLKALYSPWADYYKPMPTTTQYKISYQSRECTTSNYYGIGLVPVYLDGYGSWGNKNWSGVYLLPFLEDDDLAFYNYYCKSYYHFYSGREDDVLYLYLDVYSLENNTITSSYKYIWDAVTYPYIGCYINTNLSCELVIYEFKLYSDYLNCTNYTELASVQLGLMMSSDYTINNGALYILRGKSTFTPNTNKNDDWGYYLSSDPFQLFATQTSIDFDKIPDNYTITINGDTIYDYSITNPETGDTSTINEYVTNNYTYITNNNGDDSGSGSGSSSGGSVSGDVNVSGNVTVGGQIDIKSDPIDININVNSVSSAADLEAPSMDGLPEGQQGLGDLIDYYDESADLIGGFFSSFYQILPPAIANLIPLAVSIIIFIGLVKVLH